MSQQHLLQHTISVSNSMQLVPEMQYELMNERHSTRHNSTRYVSLHGATSGQPDTKEG